jgi:hypothetical protein
VYLGMVLPSRFAATHLSHFPLLFLISYFCRLYFDTALDCFFLLDIIINFNTGIIYGGEYIDDRRKVVVSYLRGYFLFDVCTYVRSCTRPLQVLTAHARIYAYVHVCAHAMHVQICMQQACK